MTTQVYKQRQQERRDLVHRFCRLVQAEQYLADCPANWTGKYLVHTTVKAERALLEEKLKQLLQNRA